jgi:O-antigen/teichoic acid export membrane protein
LRISAVQKSPSNRHIITALASNRFIRKIGTQVAEFRTRRLLVSPEFWGFCSAGVRISGGLLILPLALRELPATKLGLWFLFSSLYSLFNPITVSLFAAASRAVGYSLAGAQTLKPNGFEPNKSADGKPNLPLLANLLSTYEVGFSAVSGIVGLLLFGVGCFWFLFVTKSFRFLDPDFSAFLFFCLTGALGTLSTWHVYQLGIGFRRIRDMQIINLIAISANYAVNLIGFMLGWKIWALVGGTFANYAVAQIFAFVCLLRIKKTHSIGTGQFRPSSIRVLIPQTSRGILLQMGRWLILCGPTLLASVFVPLKQVASFGLSLQAGTLIYGLASVWIGVQLPEFHMLWIAERGNEVKRTFVRQMRLLVITFLAGSTGLICCGPLFLGLLNSQTSLLPISMLGPLLLFLLLHLHQASFEDLVATTNRISFCALNLITGGCLLSSMILIGRSEGLSALVMLPFVLLLILSNWWVVRRTTSSLGFSNYLARLVLGSRHKTDRDEEISPKLACIVLKSESEIPRSSARASTQPECEVSPALPLA